MGVFGECLQLGLVAELKLQSDGVEFYGQSQSPPVLELRQHR